jgi:hypothetical protein
MNRIKALYRSWSIPCAGASVYAPRHLAEWLNKIMEPGVRRHAELFFQQLDWLQKLRQEAPRDLLAESRKHGATDLLRRIPYIGPIRAALLIALIQTPHRFRTKRQLWAYNGLALETHSRGEYHYVRGQLQRSKRPVALRGLRDIHKLCSEEHITDPGYLADGSERHRKKNTPWPSTGQPDPPSRLHLRRFGLVPWRIEWPLHRTSTFRVLVSGLSRSVPPGKRGHLIVRL